jgi:hypothetical protein
MKSPLRILSLSLVFALASWTTSAQERTVPSVSAGGPGSSSPIEVWGHERLSWDQPIEDADSLADLTFTAYIDGLVDPLEDVRCSSVRNASGFECSSRFPRMVPGPHVIAITARNSSNHVSQRSAPLNLVLRSRTVDAVPSTGTRLGSGLEMDQLVGALIDVVDIAALPDGPVLIGERRGRILTTTPGQTPTTAFDLRTVDPASAPVELFALAVGPDFAKTRAVFAVYATQRGLRLVRFTEVNGVLHNHAVLREDLPMASFAPRAALGVGPDGKIYLAVSDQVLRLNVDGSTPADGASSGLFAPGVHQPEKLVWSVDQPVMWLLGSTPQGESELRAIALGAPGRGTILRSYELGPLRVTALAFLPESAGRSSQLVVTPRDSSDLLQWRTSDGALDQAAWLVAKRVGDATAMVERNGYLWIASQSALFRVDLSRH